MKRLIIIIFLTPFIFSALSIQAFLAKFVSVGLSQATAYANVGLVIVGCLLLLKYFKIKSIPSTLKNWLFFLVIYYAIGLIGNIKFNTEVPFLKTLISPIYLIGFTLFLSYKEFRKHFVHSLLLTFSFANLLLIYFKYINFSMDVDKGIAKYLLERAGGVYGDANNAALVCLLSFVFLFYYYKPLKIWLIRLKWLTIGMTIYGLLLTFSKTGLVVLLLIIFMTQYKSFNPKKIIIVLIIFPVVLAGSIQFALKSNTLSEVQKERIENVVNIITFNTDKVELSGRDVLFKGMMNYVYENPILGNGIYFSTLIRGHNTIFGIWADAGIISFLLFLHLIFQYYRKAFLSPKKIKYFSLSVLIILTIFMLSLQTIINQPYLIVLFPFLSYELESKSILNLE